MDEDLLQPVTYGSIIYLSTESNLSSYMFSDGFVDQNVTLKSFDSIAGSGVDYYDFSFCLFMVLPFSNNQSFEVQQHVIDTWKDKLLNSEEDRLDKRKEQIAEMYNKLDSEFQFNLGIIQKSQKSSICFASSNFMLLHINSLKFLSLFQDDNNNLFLQLSAHPNPSCYFSFDPSLKLQRGRSDNFVYEDEIVYIACAKKFSGKSPYLSLLDHSEQIIGLIDSKENWKVNIYEEPQEETDYMRIGSYVWLLSSEKQLFLSAERSRDPFEEMYNFEYKTKKEDKDKQLKSRRKDAKDGFLLSMYLERRDIKEAFLQKPTDLLFDNINVHLTEIKQASDKVGEMEELSPFGLWKIEAMNVQRGGELRWDQVFRLKHVITGMFLSAHDKTMEITTVKDQSTEFRFVPIDNLLAYRSKSKSTAKISKDSFFMIQHKETQLWVGLNEDESSQLPVLYGYTKDVNTFRFREASHQSTWESYSITASQKVILSTVKHSMKTIELSQMSTFTKEQNESKYHFDQNYDTVCQLFDFFKDFLLNRQVSNMNLEQEIIQPCHIRQGRFKDQFQLGLICWFLIQIYPTFEEFETLQISPEESSLESLGKTSLRKRKGVKLTRNYSYNFKVAQDHLVKRYQLCRKAYQVLSAAAVSNKENQEFILKFVSKLSNHIGFGEFTTEALKVCFKDNKNILEDIHREQVIPLEPDPNHKTHDIFQTMAHRLKAFEPYQKIEILDLLGAFTTQELSAIFINQEKVFQSIVDNKNFLFGHLMKVICDANNDILIEYRVFVEREFESRLDRFDDFVTLPSRRPECTVMVEYFKQQLLLYSKLCQNRNYACVKNMQELLPQKILLRYLNVDRLGVDIKAILCSLISNLYVDQEPKSIINKPSFVRVFQEGHGSKKEDITEKFIQINLRDDIDGTYEIRKWLIQYLLKKVEILESVEYQWRIDITEQVYNELTYEVVKTVSYMVKFGLFTKYANELFSNSVGGTNVGVLEQVVQCLAKLLEFDFNYFTELLKNEFKWSHKKQEQVIGLNMNFMSAGLNLFQDKKEEEEIEEEELKKKSDQDPSQSYHFLKRYASLFKLIKTFTNKTCRNVVYEVSSKAQYTVMIKKQICIIFSDLLEWREDYYIENAIKYFQTHYGKRGLHYTTLMPEFSVDPGKYGQAQHHQHHHHHRFKKYVEQEELQDFDHILGRPFVEVIILSFYFATDSDLQNLLANLLFKRYTQREKLVQNLIKVSLVEESNDSYQKLSTIVNEIKNLISYSQSWLQIIETNVYDEKAEETLRMTLVKFNELLELCQETNDSEAFLIKQKILKHLGGHKLILRFIESAVRIMQTRVEYFYNNKESVTEFSYKKEFIKYVQNVFQISHQIMSKFVQSNQLNQASVYKIYIGFMDTPVMINIGQVEFLQKLFWGNLDLCIKPQQQLLKFVLQLIKGNGHRAEFLQILQVLLDVSKQQESIEIQLQVLTIILQNYKYFDPSKSIKVSELLPSYYSHPADNHKYCQAFIQLVSECLSNELSMNYIVQLNDLLHVGSLLQLLLDECKRKQGSLLMKQQIYQILIVFFDKIDLAVQQFQDACEVFVSLLKIIAERITCDKTISKEDQILIGCYILGLVNIYFEKFLKDIGIISLKMLAEDEGIQKERFIFTFAQILIDNFKKFTVIVDAPDLMHQNLNQLGINFSIPISEEYHIKKLSPLQKVHAVKDLLKAFHKAPVEKRKSEYLEKWQQFVTDLSKDVGVKKCLKEERLKFPDVLFSIQDIFEKPMESIDVRLRELIISKDDIILRFLQYIQYWKIKNANKNTALFILKGIRSMLHVESESEQVKRQNHLDSLGATQIALKLYWKDKNTEDEYIYQLIKLIIGLLHGGNKLIQMNILALFQSNPDSEAFFNKVFNVLSDYMAIMKKTSGSSDESTSQKNKRKFIEKTLCVIQLLCEGHNTYLQNYLRQQSNSKVSYDIVSLMVKLVISNRISDGSYASLVQCLETLTEVVQGPCQENQQVIVTSKFIQWSIDLLKEEEKLFETRTENHKKVLAIHSVRLKRLKYKCTVTLLSLLEMQEDNEEIMNILIRSIPCNILVSELGKMYTAYKLEYNNEYVAEAFKTYLDEDNLFAPKNEVIVEYGFNLFTLINILILKNKKDIEPDLEEIYTLVKEYQFIVEKSLDDLLDFNVMGGLDFMANLKFKDDQDEESSELKKELELRQKQVDGFKFFSENTVIIEILRDGELQRIYFPLLPQCKMLPKESKTEFHNQVDHSSIRDKLVTLMNQADYMRKIMEHEELLRNIFKRIKIVELIATHKAWWENLAFITNVVLNLMIILSYSQYVYTDTLPTRSNPDFNSLYGNDDIIDWIGAQGAFYEDSTYDGVNLAHARLYEPRLFFMDEFDWTGLVILILGYINLGFSLLVMFFFAIKKAPLLLTDMWNEFMNIPMGYTMRFIRSIYMILKSFIVCLVDFDFAYYCGYMTCIVLGIVVHPFLFVFLLVDFLRIETLKIVIKAIWISKGQMGLSFLVFLLVQYYFTILAYLYFYDQYDNDSCNQIWRCFLQTFDQTFKNGGAIGDYLSDSKVQDASGSQLPFNYYALDEDQQYRYLYRFIFDVLFKFILVVLIINMVAGIIIDAFGALKDQMLEKKSFLEDYCFICGIETEKLDKCSEFGYYSHIKKNHYMWNYVYYKVYLLFKPKTELSGNETYVKRLVINNEIDWFPIKQAMGFIDDDEVEEEASNLQLVEEVHSEMQQLEQIANQANSKVKALIEKQYL